MTNLLPLESFRSAFGYHPWHFWQLAGANNFPVSSDCADLVYRYMWQANDSVGREDIIKAIESAENKLQDHLRYAVAPHYVTETLYPERWYDTKLNRVMYNDSTGRWLNVQLPEGKIQTVGVETRTIIGAALLVYSDSDGDGLNDTWSTSIATTVTDPTQIEAMFISADRGGAPVGDEWAVKPITVTIAGGMATITGRAWQTVKPAKYDAGTAVDPTNAANFATSLDIYRHYCDPTGTTQDTAQAVLIWETQPWPYFVAPIISSITPNSTDPAALGYALARVTVRDAENGVVAFGEAQYDSTSGQWLAVTMSNFRPPDRILIRYLAGEALDSRGQMQDRWQRIVAHFAAAELGKRVCACNGANRAIYDQQVDHSFSGDARVEKFTMTQSDDVSPFGYKEGQLEAWRVVRQLRQFVGVIG